MHNHFHQLKSGRPIEVPIYDFATHKRREEFKLYQPKKYLVIDGILILTKEEIRAAMDLKVFIHTKEEVRFQRRLKRDVEQRGRTPEGIIAQYQTQVKPMHDQYVEPCLQFCDERISGESEFSPEIERILKNHLVR